MNKKLLNILVFTVGAAVGSAVTWKLVKNKYEQIANEEIASVKEEYADLLGRMKTKLQEDRNCENSTDAGNNIYTDDYDQAEYDELASIYRSSDEDEEDEDEEDEEDSEEGGKWDLDEDEVPYMNAPYVITPDDFSSSPPGYNAQPLNYFADGVLADDWGVVLDLDETIGEDSVEHFGEYVDDVVYVRDERLEIDYEVTRDPRTYKESLNRNSDPYC